MTFFTFEASSAPLNNFDDSCIANYLKSVKILGKDFGNDQEVDENCMNTVYKSKSNIIQKVIKNININHKDLSSMTPCIQD
jgi:hypothetical protein